jgi:glucokinase
VALIVDHVEDVATHLPMVSRILHLLVIDILAVGVAMKRGAESVAVLPADTVAGLDEAQQRAAPVPATRRAGPGISAAGTLAHLTSHSR